MQSGSLLEIAEVLKCLVEIQAQKPLSFREKKMLERARLMLVSELATSRGVSESDAVVLLSRSLAKASLKFPEPL
jgi:CarD family transcriptional regulator